MVSKKGLILGTLMAVLVLATSAVLMLADLFSTARHESPPGQVLGETVRSVSLPHIEHKVTSNPSDLFVSSTATRESNYLRVRVIGKMGEVVPLASVYVYDESGDWYLHDKADVSGRVTIRCESDACVVVANADGGTPSYGTATSGVVVFVEGMATETLVLPDASSQILVRVKDELQRPVKGVLIESDGPSGSVREGVVATDADGEALWTAVVPGRWTVSVKQVPRGFSIEGRDSMVADVGVESSMTTDFKLSSFGTLIVNLDQLQHIKDVEQIRITPALGFDKSRRVGPWLSRAEEWRLPAGKYGLIVDWSSGSENYSPSQLAIVQAGGVTVMDVPVFHGDTIRGVVRDVNGLGVDGARVTLRAMSTSLSLVEFHSSRLSAKKEFVTQNGGEWEISGMPKGRIWINLYLEDSVGPYLAKWPTRMIVDVGGLIVSEVEKGCRIRCFLPDELFKNESDKFDVKVIQYSNGGEAEDAVWDVECSASDKLFELERVPFGQHFLMVASNTLTERSITYTFDSPPSGEEGEVLDIEIIPDADGG